MTTARYTVPRNLHPEGRVGLSLLCAIAYAFSIPFDAVQVVGGRSVSAYLGVLLVAAVLLEYRLRFGGRRISAGFIIASCAWVGWIALSSLWSGSPSATALVSIAASVVVINTIALALAASVRPTLVLSGFVAGSVAIGGLILAQPESIDSRQSFVGDPNQLAITMAVAVVISLVFALKADRWRSAFPYWAASLLLVSAVLATGSRTGVASLVFGAVVGVGSAMRAMGSPARVRVVIALGVVGALSAAASFSIPERLATPTEWSEASSWTERVSIWTALVQNANPIIGEGFGTVVNQSIEHLGVELVAHNVIVSQYVQGGFVGIVLFLTLLVSCLSDLRNHKLASIIAPSLVVLAGGSFTLSLELERVVWFVLSLGLAPVQTSVDRPGGAESSS